jgi:hypothetical protein
MNTRNEDKWTPLYIARWYKQNEVAKLLGENGRVE